MAAKRKTPSAIDQKGKKHAVLAKLQHILAHPKPLYPAYKDKREVLHKDLEQMGCG
jgi:hypothetical protein